MSARGLQIRSVTQDDWRDIAGQFTDLTFEQSATYALAAAERIGAQAIWLVIADGSEVVAAAALRLKVIKGLGRGIAWAPSGPLLHRRGLDDPDPERVNAVLAALAGWAERTGHVLRIRFPAMPQSELALGAIADAAGFQPTDRAKGFQTVLCDCTQDDDTLMAALHGKWRNPLRNALKAGLALDEVSFDAGYDRFDRMFRQVQSAKDFAPDIAPSFYVGLEGADFQHRLMIATHDGQDLGAMSMAYTAGRAVYLFGATTDAGRKLNAGHFLMWQAITRPRDAGASLVDLGGIDAEANPDVTRFKLRTGGIRVQAAGPYAYQPKGWSAQAVLLAEAAFRKLKGLRG